MIETIKNYLKVIDEKSKMGTHKLKDDIEMSIDTNVLHIEDEKYGVMLEIKRGDIIFNDRENEFGMFLKSKYFIYTAEHIIEYRNFAGKTKTVPFRFIKEDNYIKTDLIKEGVNKMNKNFKIGDKVMITEESNKIYGITRRDKGCECEIINNENEHFLVKILKHKNSYEIGEKYWIEGKYLELIENTLEVKLEKCKGNGEPNVGDIVMYKTFFHVIVKKSYNLLFNIYVIENIITGEVVEDVTYPEIEKYIIKTKKLKNILDEKEKEYLSDFLKPYKKDIENISKKAIGNILYIRIELKDDYIGLPYLKNKSMYKNMEVNKKYTVEELKLFE